MSEAEHRSSTLSDLFTNAMFGDTDISLLATLGLYVALFLMHVHILRFED